LEQGPALLRFSRATLERGLDAFLAELTADHLGALVLQELGHARRLDGFCSSAAERETRQTALAFGPELLVHVAPGNLPSPALMSMVLGLLVRSAQFVKCSRGASLIPRLFAHSIYEADHKLGACLELAEWPGGSAELEAALFAEANCVTVPAAAHSLSRIWAPRQLRLRRPRSALRRGRPPRCPRCGRGRRRVGPARLPFTARLLCRRRRSD
jgi:hypothetical protein